MAIRNLRYDDDLILYKVSRKVDIVDDKIRELIYDMFETMYKYNGVGLSAVQVGILKRVITIDTEEENGKVALINPVIIKKKDKKNLEEGCLSFPNLFGKVERYDYVEVKGLDYNGDEVIIKATGLLAQALQHEIDHLDGKVFTERVNQKTLYYINNNGQKEQVRYDNENKHIVKLKDR